MKDSSFWDPNPDYGLGAFPGPEDGFNVTTGAFRHLIRAYPFPHLTQRNYTLTVSFNETMIHEIRASLKARTLTLFEALRQEALPIYIPLSE